MPISQIVQSSIADGVAGEGPAFSVYRATSDQSFSITSYTKVQFNTVTFDTASAWDAANYRFRPLVAGYYQLNLNLSVGASGTYGEVIASIYKNGSESAWAAVAPIATSGRNSPTVSSVIYLNGSTDYVEGFVYLQTGTSPAIQANTQRSQFSGCLVRAA